MPISLIVMPLSGSHEMDKTTVYCQDRLMFDDDRQIFNQFTEDASGKKPTIKPIPIPPQMWVMIYEEEGVVRTREDAYGNELTFVYAKQLKKLNDPNVISPRNKAIMAFVRALKDDVPLILHWH